MFALILRMIHKEVEISTQMCQRKHPEAIFSGRITAHRLEISSETLSFQRV